MYSPLEEILYEEYLNHPKNQLREAWGIFLAQYPWQWFITLTFVVDVHPEEAEKKLRVWVSQMNRQLYGRNWKRKGLGIYWVCSFEYQKRGILHIHGVMNGVEQLNPFEAMKLWERLDIDRPSHAVKTGYARIYPIKNLHATCLYVTKYVSKEGDVLFSDNMKSLKQDLFAGLERL